MRTVQGVISGAAGGEEVLPSDLAHAEAMAIVQNDGAFGATLADDFADVVGPSISNASKRRSPSSKIASQSNSAPDANINQQK
ncbi:MAG TPA: hypothetical protein VN753_16295 [Terracidiphilus sp.]|nr:hypothetical protein [Terracidiphilus sp.]